MGGWLMDAWSWPALESEARKIPQGRSLYSFSGDIASRSIETRQQPGRKPAPPFPTRILLLPFSFGERLMTSGLLLSPPQTSPISHQGFLGLLRPRSREKLLGREPNRCAPGSGPSLFCLVLNFQHPAPQAHSGLPTPDWNKSV